MVGTLGVGIGGIITTIIISIVMGAMSSILPGMYLGLFTGAIGGIIGFITTVPCCLCGFGGIGGVILGFVGTALGTGAAIAGYFCILTPMLYCLFVEWIGVLFDLLSSPMLFYILCSPISAGLDIINILKVSLNSLLNLLALE